MKNEKWMGFAALGSAALASLCCVGPTVLIALGLGGLGAFSVFEKFSSLFMGLTLVVLAAAFYFTYRKREVECEDGRCETAGGSPKAKAMLWVVTLAAAGLMSSPYWLTALSGNGQANPVVLAPGTYQTVALNIEGMTCESCSAHIQKNLKGVPGVLDASVDYGSKRAVVQCAKGKVTREALLEAVKASGYSATVTGRNSL